MAPEIVQGDFCLQVDKQLRAREAGTAFVIAVLVLFILTVLGLALVLIAHTEAEISVNLRWTEMARYNAEAGLEYAKNVLGAYAASPDGDFRRALPPPRSSAAMNQVPEVLCTPTRPGCRDYQFRIVQGNATHFIGKVLRDPSRNNRLLQYDFRDTNGQNDLRSGDIDGDGRPDVQGTVTIWVRRPLIGGQDYTYQDRVIITAEGTAPAAGAPGRRNVAVSRLEMTIGLPSGAATVEETYRTRANPSNDRAEVSQLTTQKSVN